MGQAPDPTSEVAYDAAADARRLMVAHLDASDVGVDAVFAAGMDAVLKRVFAGAGADGAADDAEEYLCSLLAAFAYLVRSVALQAAPLDPDANLRRLLADFDERGTTF